MNCTAGIRTFVPASTAETPGGLGADEPPQPENKPQAQPTVERLATLDHSIDMSWLRDRFAHAAAAVAHESGRPLGEVNVLIVDDHHIAQLNHRHLAKDVTTDVISFDLAADAGAPIHAEIAICADEAARRIRDFGHTIERELLLYALHGLLHCAGHDDQTDSGYAVMHAAEDRVLQQIGVGPTFAAESPRQREADR